MVVLVEMSTHAAQTGLHTNKTTRTKFKKCLFFTFSFSFFIHVMVIVHDAWETWCLDTSVFCYLEKRYICFFTNVCKPFKTCIILLSTWYGNQCRMLNLLCQAVCCRKKMLYQISTHSQHFKKPIFFFTQTNRKYIYVFFCFMKRRLFNFSMLKILILMINDMLICVVPLSLYFKQPVKNNSSQSGKP